MMKTGVAKCDTLGGAQDLVVINESGVYSLVYRATVIIEKF